jgi:hypothetical protein
MPFSSENLSAASGPYKILNVTLKGNGPHYETFRRSLANLESRAGFMPGIAFAFDVRGEESGSARILIGPVGPIPEEAVTRIFEPLFTTKQGGNGLGLAIARNIARAHGGDLMLRSNEPAQVPTPRFLSPAKPGPARNWWPARFITAAPAPRNPSVRAGQGGCPFHRVVAVARLVYEGMEVALRAMAAASILHRHDVTARGKVVFLRQRHPGTLVVGRAHQQDRETSRCIGTIRRRASTCRRACASSGPFRPRP